MARWYKLVWVTSAGIGSAAAADILIAVSLCYYLYKSKTGSRRTDSLISTLMIYTLTTGVMTSVIDTIIVISFATMPQNFVWLALFWIVGRCYVNSFLAALNSRESLRERIAAREGSFIHLSPVETGNVNEDLDQQHKCGHRFRHPAGAYRSNSDLSLAWPPPLAPTSQPDTVGKTDRLDSPGSASWNASQQFAEHTNGSLLWFFLLIKDLV
ncbi:hypothetical protein PM082_017535 [Marasmius tenuissimus]|nr:hypothetical protein PM082_017535 [Marasmius tenuissimus]